MDGTAVNFSSVAVAEIDGDASDGLETAVAMADGTLAVYKADGTLLWETHTPNFGCGGSNNRILSSPAVGTLYGDGIPYVVVGYGGVGGRTCDGGVAAYRGTDGASAWIFSTKAFAKQQHFWSFSSTVFSSPTLVDTDGDGRLEVGFGSFDRNVYLLNFDGTVRWYYNAADTVWSSAAFATVGNEPTKRMFIGTDISGNSRINPPTKNGGFVYAFDTGSKSGARVGFRQRGGYIWKTWVDQVVQSSPVIADVLPSPGDELIVGSGCFFPQGKAVKKGHWVKILSASTGKVLQTLDAPGCLSSSVAIGDIDGDGQPEIVATVNGVADGDGKSRIVAWKPGNPTPIWSVIPRAAGGTDNYAGNIESPILADLDGNGSLEVIASVGGGLVVLNGIDGASLTCPERDCADGRPSLVGLGVFRTTPAVADVNGDGSLELVAGGAKGSRGMLYGWTDFAALNSTPGPLPRFKSAWPMFHGDAQRSGVYKP